jgi:hypothetical protein
MEVKFEPPQNKVTLKRHFPMAYYSFGVLYFFPSSTLAPQYMQKWALFVSSLPQALHRLSFLGIAFGM